MVLFATMSYDDEDPDLHTHLTNRARDLDRHNRPELIRVLGTMEDALKAYAIQVARVRAKMEDDLALERARSEAPR